MQFVAHALVQEKATQIDYQQLRTVVDEPVLAGTMRGYRRWALEIAGTARYDHTDACDHLIKVIDRAASARTAKLDELLTFVTASRTMA